MNTAQITNLLLTKATNQTYAKRYIKFITWRASLPKEGQTEQHHILPKAKTLFPEFSSFRSNPWNRIELSPREHFIAHWILWKAMGQFMAYAFLTMRRANKNQSRHFRLNSKSYARLREDSAQCQSTRVITDETRARMRESQKNRAKLTCPHCGKTGDIMNMKRYHFDNCKSLTGATKHNTFQDHTIVECPHCGVTGKAQGMRANHFDNCSVIRGDYRKVSKTITCPHCGKTGKDTALFHEYHFDNCSSITGVKVRRVNYDLSTVTCPHCGKSGKAHGMKPYHFDKCPKKPTEPH